jgi:myosin-5
MTHIRPFLDAAAMDAEFVWVRDPAQVWLLVKAVFAADGSGSVLATLSDGSKSSFKPGEFFPSNPKLLEGIDDLTGLQHLDEPNILHNLSVRFQQDKIYSFTGPILVAVNPWKRLPLYSSAVLLNYLGRSRSERPPHVFAIAEAAYRAMVNYDSDQSVLVSGESGAGKTETTKFVMQYLAALSGGAACSSSSSIERQVLESNPLLEAFGNAKTIRNDNSSRFGKFIRIGFDGNGKLITAQVETYLLEKSRVTYVAAAERSYHIFYQLCAVTVHAGGDVEMESSLLQMFRSLQLGPCTDYAMLTRNESVQTVDGVDDLQSFFRMAEAMATINLSPDSLRLHTPLPPPSFECSSSPPFSLQRRVSHHRSHSPPLQCQNGRYFIISGLRQLEHCRRFRPRRCHYRISHRMLPSSYFQRTLFPKYQNKRRNCSCSKH